MVTLHFQETFVDLQVALKTHLRQTLKTFYEGEFNVTTSHLPIGIQDLLQDFCKMFWRRCDRQELFSLKTSSRRLQDMSWRCHLADVFKRPWRPKKFVLAWNLYQYFTNLSLFLKILYLTNLYHTKDPSNFYVYRILKLQ